MNEQNPSTVQKPVARLALSNGQLFTGLAFGDVGKGLVSTGELVFNTAMCGYQESLTDPSYMGQILIQTQPLIGNTGVNPEDVESAKVQVSGFVIHELTQHPSNYRLSQELSEYLSRAGVLGIADLDTRALTRSLRTGGVVQAVLTDRDDLSDAELVQMARDVKSMSGQNLAGVAGSPESCDWQDTLESWGADTPAAFSGDEAPTVLLFDFGIKSNIARHLAHRGLRVKLMPQSTTAQQIKDMAKAGEAHGVFLSNGPGDPEAVKVAVATLRELIEDSDLSDLPIYGICLGHQLLCLAMGAKTYKLPFGHRGANQPVHAIETGRVEITSQNHGFAVEPQSLKSVGGVITHIHLNDNTVAGFRHATRPIKSVQFHPEASPGPHDAVVFFDDFVRQIKTLFPSHVAP